MAQVPVIDLLAEVTQICRECPTQILLQAYVRAARRLCNHSRWLTFGASVITQANAAAYVMVCDDDHEIIGIRAAAIAENDTNPADDGDDPLDTADYEPLAEGLSGTAGSLDDSSGVPDTYRYLPTATILLHPAPMAVYGVRVMCVVQPKADTQNLNHALVAEWGYALQAGALAWLLALPRTPWTDKTEARAQEALFTSYMNQAASSAQRGYNAGAEATDSSTSGGLRTRMQAI